MTAVPATAITDPAWLRAHLGLAARRYGCAPAEVLGTIWWYSASSVLVAPAVESLASTGRALDPALPSVTLEITGDGRLVGAASSREFPGDLDGLGQVMGRALEAAVTAIASVTGARPRALRAVATDSIANRLLWAGAPELAGGLVAAIGERMPRPRYAEVGSHQVVRRASCCLIYQVGRPKCLSCPRQLPAERERRLHRALSGP